RNQVKGCPRREAGHRIVLDERVTAHAGEVAAHRSATLLGRIKRSAGPCRDISGVFGMVKVPVTEQDRCRGCVDKVLDDEWSTSWRDLQAGDMGVAINNPTGDGQSETRIGDP